MVGLLGRDGVVDVDRLAALTPMPLLVVPPGPRGWRLVSVDADGEDDGPVIGTRLEWRAGDRALVIAQRPAGGELDALARQVATGLAFRAWRAAGGPGGTASFLAGFDGTPRWAAAHTAGWSSAAIPAPGGITVRLRSQDAASGCAVVGATGVASEELDVVVAQLEPVTNEAAGDLRRDHRRALAQRWWDAPRTPWTGR